MFLRVSIADWLIEERDQTVAQAYGGEYLWD